MGGLLSPSNVHLSLQVGTNTGAALLELDAPPAPLPVSPIPLRSPLQAHPLGASPANSASSKNYSGSGSSGVSYFVSVGDSVACVECSTSSNVREWYLSGVVKILLNEAVTFMSP